MRIAGVASAFPKHSYPQELLLEELKSFWGDRLQQPQLLDRYYRRMGIERRYLALPKETYRQLKSWGEANDTWIRVATELGEEAVQAALQRSGLSPDQLGAFLLVSVTGVASPSVDALLVNRMGLPLHIKRMPIFGLGCVAGAAGLARAADYVKAFPGQAAVILSVELCSLTLQKEDVSAANLISAGLFGDGAAAAILTGEELDRQGPEVVATRSFFYPGTEEMMGWRVSEKGFTILLSPEVPEMVRKHLGENVDEFLNGFRLSRKDIKSWITHTGGPKILEAISETLQLSDGALDPAWRCLRRVGNLSSASVLLVLEEVMQNDPPPANSYGLLLAMGPGFCSELVLLKW